MTHLLGAHLHNPSHSCGAGKANKTAVTQAWRVLGTQGGGKLVFQTACNPRKKIISLYAFHGIWWQNGLWLSHCLRAIPQIPCLLSAGWVVDSVTLAVNGPKHFCQQIKLCWNIKKIGPNRGREDSCLAVVSFAWESLSPNNSISILPKEQVTGWNSFNLC